ncbi:MAG: efflux RND transporter periplasmic adaptor subunit [Anaerolineales bacterium]
MNAIHWFSKIPIKTKVGILLAILIAVSAGGYSVFAYQSSAAESEETTLQTATIGRGDLSISASGTGILSTEDEVELSFSTSGTVTKVYVHAGDEVQAGDVLAEIDNTQVQEDYLSAEQAYMELTSPKAIASSLEALADAEKSYSDTLYQLEYLVSPDVLYWDQNIAAKQKDLEIAQNRLEIEPENSELKLQLQDIEAYLESATALRAEALNDYYNEYVFENFVRRDDEGHQYLALPTEADITLAQYAVDDAQTNLTEAQTVYTALSSGEIPVNTGISSLEEILSAKRALEEAKATADGTKIIAPQAGTIITVDIKPGDQVDTGTCITLTNLLQPHLDIYLDESDWDKIEVGYPVEVEFDALPDNLFTGTVTSVDSELYTSNMSSSVHGTVSLGTTFAELDLPIGASASAEVLSVNLKNILLIPLEALKETEDGTYTVYVLKNNEVKLRTVDIGIRNELYAEIKSGLNEGDVVVTGKIEE